MAEHMRAWQCAAPGPIDKTLKLVEDAEKPTKALQNGQILVKIARASLNPADYKILELGMAAKAITQFPKTPGMDFSGRVVDVAQGVEDVKPNDSVLGRLVVGKNEGSLSEFAIVNRDSYIPIPSDFDLDQAAGAPTAAMTAYLSIVPHAKVGDRVFINGGSGGVGLFTIQVAKIIGCHITVSCSTEKAALCRAAGADDIIDYKANDVIAELRRKGQVHSLIVDNVGNSPPNLYALSHNFLLQGGKFVFVGGAISSTSATSLARSLLLPGFLGGGKRKFVVISVHPDREVLGKITEWMEEGRLKTVIDSVFNFDDAPSAFEHLKKGSSGGKIVIRVDEGK